MRFVPFSEVADRLRGKRIAVVGSGPGVLDNEPGFIDSHDVVIRANNYRLSDAAGHRTDAHYSFYGSSIRKTATELQRDGVTLCLNKCPDAKPIECKWHEERGKQNGIDFRYIFKARRDFWFCDTYIPTVEHFMRSFRMLDGHIPTTGFAAILDAIEGEPASIHLTGFDFFTSGVHNVNERWKAGDPTDPIGHRPDLEIAWLRQHGPNHPLTMDRALQAVLARA